MPGQQRGEEHTRAAEIDTLHLDISQQQARCDHGKQGDERLIKQ